MKEELTENYKSYDLLDGYSIESANWEEFSPYFAVYEIFEANVWFRQSFNFGCEVLKDDEDCYWIKKDDCRIGGVLLEPNYMCCLFLIPPYDNEFQKVLGKLKNILLSWSDKSKAIYDGVVKPKNVKYYQRLGFKTGESRRCMIRPTEKFEVIWSDEYRIAPVRKENQMEIVELYKDSFKSVEDFQNELSVEKINEVIQYYFDNNSEDSLVNKASTLVYDKKTNQLIGASLISIWEEWPNVYQVAVRPSFQGKGIGNNMLKHALTILKEEYPVLRLFVTLGNNAELLYYKLGFLGGVETTEMILPPVEQK